MRQIRTTFEGSLHVYGKGEPAYETQLRDYVTRHQLPVTFHHATPEQMPDVYRAHDALLFTSEWEEPFALTPLEAMASGLPVIGTLTGGSAELLRHGQNALTYHAGNAAELAARITTLATDPSLRATLARAGQQEVRASLNLNLITSEIEAYLSDSLASWQAPTLPTYHAP
jgi:glycosyltransferase involved in cell wall biosynthesis